MHYFCLTCPHDWDNRGASSPKQCPSCWGRVLASREELRLGRIFLRPWAYLAKRQPPPLPAIGELPILPFCALNYHNVMQRTKNAAERQRAAQLMLEEDGFQSAEASQLAVQMFPQT